MGGKGRGKIEVQRMGRESGGVKSVKPRARKVAIPPLPI